jgi:hypothetical protein
VKSLYFFGIILFLIISASACEGMVVVNTTVVSTSQPTSMISTTNTPKYLDVVYINNGDIWIWKNDIENSQPIKLTEFGDVQDVRVSDDGEVIAFKRGDLLYGMSLFNKNIVPLIDRQFLTGLAQSPYRNALIDRFDFAPGDGHVIYITTYVLSGMGNVSLLKIDVDNNTTTRIFAPGEGGIFYISPDGKKLVITRSNTITISDSNGASAKQLFLFPEYSGFSTTREPDIVWGTGGFSVVVPAVDSQNRLLGLQKFMFIDFNGKIVREVDLPIPPMVRTYISPDGQKVAYLWDHGDLADLFISEVNNPQILENKLLSFPSNHIGLIGWANDSKHIMFWLITDNMRYSAETPLIISIGEPYQFMTSYGSNPESVHWIDDFRYLYVGQENNLYMESCSDLQCPEYIGKINSISEPVASPLIYDFTFVNY